MIEKEKIIKKIEIMEDGTMKVSEQLVFIENGEIINEGLIEKREIFPGMNVDTEKEKIRNAASIFHDEQTTKNFVEKREKRSMGYNEVKKVKGIINGNI